MSDKSTYSLRSRSDKNRDTIPCRIDFIKDLLSGKRLSPLVDFNNSDTECFISNIKDENESGQSYDTTIVLKKRRLNFEEIINQIGGKLQYVKSGTTGHTFKGSAADEFGTFEYSIKVTPFPKKERYGGIHDVRRPENAEILMIKVLSYFIAKKQTPHIVLPIGTFDTNISTFVNLINDNVVHKDNDKYNEFVKRYNKNEYHKTVSILIAEWANRGDLLDFIRKYHKEFTPTHWKAIFFQVLSVLAVIQSKYPTFRHNDLKANNVLIHKITKQTEFFTYKVARCSYRVRNIGYQIKIWDFDFACIPGIVDNKKVQSEWTKQINVTPVQNRYYDVHYFFNTLIKKGFCPDILTGNHVPQELKDFINRIIPPKYQKSGTEFVAKKGRILVNDEYLTADDILKHDPYFEEYRCDKTSKNSQYMSQSSATSAKKTIPTKKVSSGPDLTQFLKNSSSEDKPKKKPKSSNMNNAEQILNRNSKHQKDKNKTVSKKSKSMLEEFMDLDPDKLLNYTQSDS
jgi:hypothetical protein